MSDHVLPYHGSSFSTPTGGQEYRRLSPNEEGRPPKKPRTSRPKVRSGCITCKTRRVKCDENKPSCLRCVRSGRQCDGYVTETPASRGLIQLQPRIPIGNPSLPIHATESESRYFRIFAERTAYELSGFFEPTFWTRLVLQESHNVVAIRHAVIALGALNMSLDAAPKPDLKVNIIQRIDRKHHEQAVYQHIKAIQALNQYISYSKSPQLRSALIACLLFVCFETLQGSYASSVQQTYGGLKILRNYYQGKPGSRPWIPGPAAPGKGRKKISQALLEREGCDHVFNEVAIVMHVEEYLDNESNPPEESRMKNDACSECSPQAGFAEPAVYDPSAEHVEIPARQMSGTDFNKEQQRTLDMYSQKGHIRRRTNESPVTAIGLLPESPWQAQNNSRKGSGSSTFSNTTAVSSPVAYTPPSTGPHTPSPSQTSHPSSSQLANSRKRPLTSRSPTPLPILQNDVSIEEVLIQSFVRLDGQGLFFGMIPGIPPLYWDIHKVWDLPIPTYFPDFRSAQRCWDFLMDRALQFYRRTTFNRAYASMSSDSPASIAKQHAFHTNALNKFAASFQPILSTAISPDGSEITNPAALILSLYLKCTSIILATIPEDSEMLYDSFLPDFKYIVRTCSRLISAQEKTQLPKNPRFSFDVGVIPPLHITATKCRDPGTRRAAIDLLFASPRQEGMWDGVLTARIGRWIVGVEEEGLLLPEMDPDSDDSGSYLQNSWPRASGQVQEPEKSGYGYPSPPELVDERGLGGGWQNGRKISDIVNKMIGHRVNEFAQDKKLVKGVKMRATASNSRFKTSARRSSALDYGKGKGVESGGESPSTGGSGSVVPKENRVQLLVVDFHIPEQFIKVKCQRALPRKDGTREERETVIAW